MRLAVSVLAVLLLVLAAFASVGCTAAAAGTPAMTAAADGAAGVGICPAPIGDAAKAALAAGAREAPDAQPDHEDGLEAATATTVAVGLVETTRLRAGMPAAAVPAPWLHGLLRPPRASSVG